MAMALLALVAALTDNECTDYGVCPPDNDYAYTGHSTLLRQDLLSNYDSAVPPTSNRTSASNFHSAVPNPEEYITTGTRAGTDVGMQIVFYKHPARVELQCCLPSPRSIDA